MKVEELYDSLKKSQETKGYYFNKDRKRVFDLLQGLLTNKERYGYMCCPCRLAAEDRDWDKDIICPCVYREPDVAEYGSCYCNLYVSRAWNEDKIPHIYIPERRPPEKMFKIMERTPPIVFLEPLKPVPAHKNYTFWGLLAGAVSGILVGHPLFMMIYVFYDYLNRHGPLDFGQAILLSFSPHAWPLTLFFALSGALFGSLLGWVYGLLIESRFKQEFSQKEFELQVSSLRHHYKNLAIGIKGLSNRVKNNLRKLDEVLDGICAKRGDCPGFQAYSQEFQNLEKHVVILDNTAKEMETMLAKELEMLRALASDCRVFAPQDLYSVLRSCIQTLLEVRFQEKELKVEVNGQPWKEVEELLSFQFEPYTTEVVLQNILGNAMKYGNHIQVRVLDQANELQIEVEDDGPGLEVQQLRNILAEYTCGKTESSHLGLTVSLYLLTKCGGRLGISSEPGKGATFYMLLPK